MRRRPRRSTIQTRSLSADGRRWIGGTCRGRWVTGRCLWDEAKVAHWSRPSHCAAHVVQSTNSTMPGLGAHAALHSVGLSRSDPPLAFVASTFWQDSPQIGVLGSQPDCGCTHGLCRRTRLQQHPHRRMTCALQPSLPDRLCGCDDPIANRRDGQGYDVLERDDVGLACRRRWVKGAGCTSMSRIGSRVMGEVRGGVTRDMEGMTGFSIANVLKGTLAISSQRSMVHTAT